MNFFNIYYSALYFYQGDIEWQSVLDCVVPGDCMVPGYFFTPVAKIPAHCGINPSYC